MSGFKEAAPLTLSPDQQRNDAEFVLIEMTKDTADRLTRVSVIAVQGNAPDPKYRHIAATTWTQLVDRGWLATAHALGQPRYHLTRAGWLEGLRRLGELHEGTTTWNRALALAQAMKAQVRGRALQGALVYVQSLADEARVPVEWMCNALESGLLATLFHAGMVARLEGRHVRIPQPFGIAPIDL